MPIGAVGRQFGEKGPLGDAAADSFRGYLFDLHVHSTYSSDSSISPKVTLTRARQLGLRGLALTDHDRLTRIDSPFEDLLLVPGAELSTDWGDLLALGIEELPREGLSVPEIVEDIHRQGGAAVIPHPFTTTPVPYAMNERVYEIIDIVDGLEVTSPKPFVDNRKARALVEKHAKAPVGGSDAHRPEMLGSGLTVSMAGDLEGLLRALRAGETGAIIRK